jgi:tetratricopeptide (TPR) repeat protein/transcriptional regulator with XRE-family HTH domain
MWPVWGSLPEALVASHRRRLGLTQDELAERTGLSVRTIRKLESGDMGSPRLTTIRLLADAFGLCDEERDRLIQAASEPAPASKPPVAAGGTPAQLPADVAGFTGRIEELSRLDALIDERAGTAVLISAVTGAAGVGKTALAVHWAHRVRDAFPDGQVFVNLRGFDPTERPPMEPAKAIRLLLDALDVPPQRIPYDLDAQIGLYRTLVTGRRLLVLLDNARDAAQVRPLLPGGSTSMVVVTSRNDLVSLVATEGARPLSVDLFSPGDARRMLASRIGTKRVAAEPEAIGHIIAACARLPLALAVAAARAAVRPAASLSRLAAELNLEGLAGGEPATDVRTVFSLSYRALGAETARQFRLLGLHPGPDVSLRAAASIAGARPDQVRRWLGELVSANLITEPSAGRYALHDLLHAYAAERASQEEPDADRRAAIVRLLDHYLHSAYFADRLLSPHRVPIVLDPPAAGVTAERPADVLRWFRAEHRVLLAVIDLADALMLDRYTVQLAWTVKVFLDRQGWWHDWVATQGTALAAAERAGDRDGQALAHTFLGQAFARQGGYADARTHYCQALDLYRETGRPAEHAFAHLTYAWLLDQQDDSRAALEHTQQAHRWYAEAGDRSGQANALNAIGWCQIRLGAPRAALTSCERALAMLQAVGDRAGQASTWDSIGNAHQLLGDYPRALACYEQALAHYRDDVGNRYFEALTLDSIGDTRSAAGDHEAARAAWQQAVAVFEELGRPGVHRIRAKLDGGGDGDAF